MSDSLMSRADRAKFIREYRQRMKMADLFERHRSGVVVFCGASESLALAFASAFHMDSEIEWRRAELAKKARMTA